MATKMAKQTPASQGGLTGCSNDGAYSAARLTAYREGRVVARRDISGSGIESAVAALGAQVHPATIIVDAVRSRRSVPRRSFKRVFNNASRGLVGIGIGAGAHVAEFYPSDMVARNLSFATIVADFVARVEMAPEAAEAALQLTAIHSDTFVCHTGSSRLVRLYRGAQPQGSEPLRLVEVREMAARIAGWFRRNMAPTGELPYKVCPTGSTRFAGQNNTIRQLMATVSLHRYADLVDSADLRDCARRNLKFNLAQFYRDFDGVGVIAFNGSAKLGASAMAALAIYEQEGRSGQHRRQLAMLLKGIDSLWQDNGAFRTFHFPMERNDNQNFYPGEALCLWARLLRDDIEPDLLRRFLKSFEHYRAFHRTAPNPAFIPWHTQAYWEVYRITKANDLSDFIFEMNDWLLGMQQDAEAPCPDFVGRFYDPDRREFGPPHASSTAVYLEGLIDAFGLASTVCDAARADKYAQAIRLGLLNLRTLQLDDTLQSVFRAPLETYLGALRTNPYDCLVRVDNAQHALAALTKYLAEGDRLEPWT